MMVLTLREPLATLATHGFKRLDGRAYATNYRGPVALYAPKTRRDMNRREFRELCLSEPFKEPLYHQLKIATCFRLPRGLIIGVAQLVDVERLDAEGDLPAFPELAMGGYGPLCCIWHLEDAHPLESPIRVPRGVARGGLWTPPKALREEISRRAGVRPPTRLSTNTQEAMTAAQSSAKSKPKTSDLSRETYVVVSKLCWKGQMHEPGEQISFATKGSHSNRDRWLSEERIRPLRAGDSLNLQPTSLKRALLSNPAPDRNIARMTREQMQEIGKKVECQKLSEQHKKGKLPSLRAFDYDGGTYVATDSVSMGNHGYIEINACSVLKASQILGSAIPKVRDWSAGDAVQYGRKVVVGTVECALGMKSLTILRSDCLCDHCVAQTELRENGDGCSRTNDLPANDDPGKNAATFDPAIPLSEINRSPWNPRRDFTTSDEAKLAYAELVESIRAQGIILPLVVRPMPKGEGYELIAGERRWRAAADANLITAPCIVRTLSDKEAIEVQVVENLQRRDLNPMEEAEGYASLRTKCGLSVADICKKTGKSEAAIYAKLKLLECPPGIKQAVEENRLPASTAELVARLPREHQGAAMDAILFPDEKGEEASGVLSFRQAKEVLQSLSAEVQKEEEWKKTVKGHHLHEQAEKILTVAESNKILFGGGYLTAEAQKLYCKPEAICYEDPARRTWIAVATDTGIELPPPILARECAEGKVVVLHSKVDALEALHDVLPDPQEFARRQQAAGAEREQNRRDAAERQKAMVAEMRQQEERRHDQVAAIIGACETRKWDGSVEQRFLRNLLLVHISAEEDAFYAALERRARFDEMQDDGWPDERIAKFVAVLSTEQMRGWLLELAVHRHIDGDGTTLINDAIDDLAELLLPDRPETADVCGSANSEREPR